MTTIDKTEQSETTLRRGTTLESVNQPKRLPGHNSLMPIKENHEDANQQVTYHPNSIGYII